MEKDNYSAEALKERGHGVIEESKWENFDKMVDNNCKSWMGLRYVDSVLLLCEIMHNEAMPLADRRRQAYDKFQEFDCNGTAAHMICGALRDLCPLAHPRPSKKGCGDSKRRRGRKGL